MRLIDADALWANITNKSACLDDCCPRAQGKKGVLALIDEAPTIEAEPVKHDKWEFIVTHNGCTDDYDCKCSECGKSGVPSDRYCSYCGAKMTNTDSFDF